jgi:hypothetical protein
MAAATAVERLDFVLHPFVRFSWVSDGAREVWAPRLRRVLHAWEHVEVATVREGLRPCAAVRLTDEVRERWANDGAVAVLEIEAGDERRLPLSAVGAADDARALVAAWARGDHDAIGALLGYPPCCREAHLARSGGEAWLDPTWQVCLATPSGFDDGAGSFRSVSLTSPSVLNVLWRCLGIRAVAHVPCHCECPASVRLAAAWLGAGRTAGTADEMGWLEEILSWPAEWTALHGIAEIRTPLMRISTRTDATAEKLAVRWLGDRYPDEGARGVAFPYRVPARAVAANARRVKREAEAFIPLRPI